MLRSCNAFERARALRALGATIFDPPRARQLHVFFSRILREAGQHHRRSFLHLREYPLDEILETELRTMGIAKGARLDHFEGRVPFAGSTGNQSDGLKRAGYNHPRSATSRSRTST